MKLFGNKKDKKNNKKPKTPNAEKVAAGAATPSTKSGRAKKPKSKHNAAVGVYILSDTEILFTELVDTKSGKRLGKFGRVTIPFGVLNGGRLEKKTGLIPTFKKLFAIVGDVDLSFWDELNQAGILAENFALSGFTSVRPVGDLRTLLRVYVPDYLTEGQSWVLRDSGEYALYHSQYGKTEHLGSDASLENVITDNTDRLAELGQKRVLIAGELSYSEALSIESVGDIEIDPVNVWQNITKFNDYVPAIDRENSLQYAIPLSLALSQLDPLAYEDLPKTRREKSADGMKSSLEQSLQSADLKPMTPRD